MTLEDPHILVVDDHREIRESLAQFLKKNGRRATAVESAEAARKAIKENRIDLVILDIMMPGMDGFAVFQAITERVEGRLPFLFITATALRVGEEWLRGIPHATMHKPLDFDLLFERVHQLLSASK